MFSIPLSSSIPFSEEINNGMAAIAKEYGIDYVTFPNQGQPSQWVQGMDQAIACAGRPSAGARSGCSTSSESARGRPPRCPTCRP